jgi:hypothetical protein
MFKIKKVRGIDADYLTASILNMPIKYLIHHDN